MLDFGIQIEPQFGFTFQEILDLAKTAETTKFTSMWFSDHFFLNTESTDRPNLDLWCILSALSRHTTLRLGTLVACNSYRYPAVHAKLAATIDQLSGGRFEFGIGAGWKEIEYDAYGIPFPSAGERIHQLTEAIQIIRLMWTQPYATFTGQHHQVEQAISFPKPYQPSPRIWVGTMRAQPKMLSLIAQHADGINIAWNFSPDACRDVFDQLDQFCSQVGRNGAEITKSVGLWASFFANEQEKEQLIRTEAKRLNMSVDAFRQRIAEALFGTKDQLIARIREYMEVGVTHFVFMFFPLEIGAANLSAFNTEVLTAL